MISVELCNNKQEKQKSTWITCTLRRVFSTGRKTLKENTSRKTKIAMNRILNKSRMIQLNPEN